MNRWQAARHDCLLAAVWYSFQNLILLRDHLAALAAEHHAAQRQSASLRASVLLDTHSASLPMEQGAAKSGEAHRDAIPAIVRRAAQCVGDDVLTCAPSFVDAVRESRGCTLSSSSLAL